MSRTRSYNIILCLSFVIPVLVSFTKADEILDVIKKLKDYHVANPQEKIYLHFDKPFYAAGENIWLKAYLVNASSHHLDSLSRVIYVDLVDKSNTVIQQKILYAENGLSYGDLKLADTLRKGKYLVRAYTNYMKNVGEDFFFRKEFSILESIQDVSGETSNHDQNSFSPDSIDLQFFPEGGNLVACGTFNRVGFQALKPDGKSIDVEGEIVDEAENVVAKFKTQHDGMGMLLLNPAVEKTYSARLIEPYTKHVFALPQVLDKGYILQVNEMGNRIKVVVFASLEKSASEKADIGIVVQSRGIVYHAEQAFINKNATFTFIPRSAFPDGVSQITIFDNTNKPVAERLIYQNRNVGVGVLVRTDVAEYEKRKMVTVFANAFYGDGSPAQGSFSISVYDDKLLPDTEQYPLSIRSYLSLTSDLKGHIENPGYYFKDSLRETKKDLDLLMMVHGWRRFTWSDVLNENKTPLPFNREKGIPVSGRVLKPGGKKSPLKSNLKIITTNGRYLIIKPDESGRFYADGLLYRDTTSLIIQTENEKGIKQPYKFLLDPFPESPPSYFNFGTLAYFDASKFLQQQALENSASKAAGETDLQDVVITAKKEKVRDPRMVGLSETAIVKVPNGYKGYTDIFQALQGRVPGMLINLNPLSVTIRNQVPTFLIDGILTPLDVLKNFSPANVEGVEVTSAGAIAYGTNMVFNVITKAGAWSDGDAVGINRAKYPGFDMDREFYSPRYDIPEERHNLPDMRTTLFWEPMLVTDAGGKMAVSFYTADVPSHYKIIIEGISYDGYPGTGLFAFDVR